MYQVLIYRYSSVQQLAVLGVSVYCGILQETELCFFKCKKYLKWSFRAIDWNFFAERPTKLYISAVFLLPCWFNYQIINLMLRRCNVKYYGVENFVCYAKVV